MHALCYLPEKPKHAINDVGVMVRAAGAFFHPVAAESEALGVIARLPAEANLVIVSSERHFDFLEKARALRPSYAACIFVHSPLSEIPDALRAFEPMCSFIAAEEQEDDAFSLDPRDLMVAIQNLKSREIFGLGKYLMGGTTIRSLVLRTDMDKRHALGVLNRSVRGLGSGLQQALFDEYASRVESMADELILNAVFNANPRYRKAGVVSGFAVQADEAVTLSFGFDGATFGLSVIDPFGSLGKETLLQFLGRPRTDDDLTSQSKSGMGLRFVFERLRHLVVNVSPGQQTEVIGLLAFEKRMRLFGRRAKSIHYFTTA